MLGNELSDRFYFALQLVDLGFKQFHSLLSSQDGFDSPALEQLQFYFQPPEPFGVGVRCSHATAITQQDT